LPRHTITIIKLPFAIEAEINLNTLIQRKEIIDTKLTKQQLKIYLAGSRLYFALCQLMTTVTTFVSQQTSYGAKQDTLYSPYGNNL